MIFSGKNDTLQIGMENGVEIKNSHSYQLFILVLVLLSISSVLGSVFLRISITIPTTWVTGVFLIYLAPIFLYTICTMLRSLLSITISISSIVLGELLWSIVYGCTGELLVYVIVSLSSWGTACLLISLLGKRNELGAMIIGGLWYFLGLLIPTAIYYSEVLSWNILYMVIYSLVAMVFNLLLIPLSLILNRLLRGVLKVEYLEELL